TELVGAHGRLVQLHALVAITFGDLFRPHENPGENALRAGVAAPDTPGEDGNEEQAEGTDDQQRRQQDEVLRPEGGAEDVELALGQVPPDRLTTIPVQPGSTKIEDEQQAAA